MSKICNLVLIVFTLVILATCDLTRDDAKCLNEHNFSHEDLVKFFEYSQQGTEKVERKFKCFTKCLFDALAYIDDNGKVDIVRFLDKGTYRLDGESATRVGNNCKEKYYSEEDGCEYAYKMMICLTVNLKNEAK